MKLSQTQCQSHFADSQGSGLPDNELFKLLEFCSAGFS